MTRLSAIDEDHSRVIIKLESFCRFDQKKRGSSFTALPNDIDNEFIKYENNEENPKIDNVEELVDSSGKHINQQLRYDKLENS